MSFEDSWIFAPILFGFVIGFRVKKPLLITRLSWRQKLVIIVPKNDVRCMSSGNSELTSFCSSVSVNFFFLKSIFNQFDRFFVIYRLKHLKHRENKHQYHIIYGQCLDSQKLYCKLIRKKI